MIFGHMGVVAALRATIRRPGGSYALMAMCVVAVLPDVLDVFYFVTGICSPFGLYSHTIPAIVLQGAVTGGLALLITDSLWLTLAFALLLPLHLAADFFTMRKLLWPGGELVGLNLYNHSALDLLLEVPVIAGGWWLLRRSGRGPSWAVGRGVLVAALVGQFSFDAYGFISNRHIKPSTCRSAEPVTVR